MENSPHSLRRLLRGRSWPSFLVTGLAALVSIEASNAQDLYWGAAGGTNAWITATNWYTDAAETIVSGAAPGASNDVIFNTDPDSALGGTVSIGANIAANSLTFNTSGTMVLAQSGNRTLTLGAGGITVNSGAGNATLGISTNALSVQLLDSQTWTNNSSSLLNVRSFRASDSAAGPVTLTLNAAGTGNISFSLAIQDSPDTTKPLSLLVDSAGTGTVSMVGSTYTGGTTINRGILTSNGNIGAGSVLLGDTSGSADVRLNLTGAANNNITVQAGSSGAAYLSGSGNGDFQGDILLNKNVAIGNVGAATTLAVSGDISGVGAVTIGRLPGATGNPTVTLSGDNSYTGKTTITSATVVVESLNRVVGGAATSSLGAPVTIADGTISMSSVVASTLRYTGAGESTDRVIEITSNLGATLDQSGSGNLEFESDFVMSGVGSRTLTLTGTTAGTGEISGAINNIGTGTNVGVTKTGVGTWRLSGTANTYANTTSITGGVLEVTKLADTGVASSIGTGAVSSLSFAGGTLRYVGSGDSSNRTFTIGAAGGTLDASGSGAVNFTRTGAPSYGSSNVAISLTLTGTNGDANTYALNQNNNGSGAVSITKNGAGKWVLTGTTTYTGGTIVNEGTLLINGSSVSAVTVNGGVFGGTGTITNSVSIGNSGTLNPGNSPGVLNTGDLSLTGTASTIAMEISGTAAGEYDQVNVTGAVNLDGNGEIEVTMLSFVPQPTDIYFLILNDDVDAISGTLFNLAQGSTFDSGGYTWQVSYTGDSTGGTFTGGNDLALQVVPEPSTWVLLTGGLMAATLLRRRRV